VTGLVLGVLLTMPSMCGYTWSDALDTIIREEAVRTGVPLDLAYTFIAAESGFDPGAHRLTDLEDSVGLLQLNRKRGQGTGYSVEELKDPRRNLQIGLPYIAAAFRQTWSPTIAPFEFIYLVSIRSGHPGEVPRDDYRILKIARIWACFFPAAGVSGPLGAPGTTETRPGPGIALAGAMAPPLLVTLFPGGILRTLLPGINPIASFQSQLAVLTPGGFQRRIEAAADPRRAFVRGPLARILVSRRRLPPRHRFPRRA
jgi:hypothetical protein